MNLFGRTSLVFSLLFTISRITAQTPGGVSTGLTLWLKANAGTSTAGVNLTNWTDQSAASTAITVNGSPDYQSNGYNFNPYINFTMSGATGGDFLHTPDLNLQSFFWVSELNDLSRSATHLATYDGVTLSAPCPGCPIHGGDNGSGVAQYLEFGYGGSNFQTTGVWRKNGNASGIAYNSPHTGDFDIVTALGQAAVPTNVFMGGQDDNGIWFDGRARDWIGPVGEIIAYSGAISAADANKIETYLAVKYGITLGGAGSTTLYYTSPNGTTIWNMNTGYHYHVAGIGNDMALEGLDQPKSHSIHTPYDAVTMANSNFTIPVSLTDGQYLLWGHNNGAFTYTCQNITHASPLTTISALYNRVWRTQKTGSPSGNVIIEIDMSLFQGPGGLATAINGDIRLLIDDNTNFGDASAGEHTYAPDAGFSATGGKIYFTVPYADIQNGTGYFGIGMASPLPVADAGSDISFCSAASSTLGTSALAGMTYAWSPTTGLTTSTDAQPSITLTNGTLSPVTTTYTITTTVTATGCTATDMADVTVDPIDDPSFTLTATCDGATANVTGTTPGTFSFAVLPGDGAVLDGVTGTITNGTSGTTYQVEYLTSGTCPNSLIQSVTVDIQDDPSFTLTPTCDGATANVTGTTPGTFSFAALPGDGAVLDGVIGTISNGTSGTTYQVEYLTSGTCPDSLTQSVTVDIQDDPSFTLTPTCDGATANVTGTTPGTFSFAILPGDGASLNTTTGTITGGTSGSTYQVNYLTSGTCQDDSTVSVTVSIQDDPSFSMSATCDGGTAAISGTTGGTFSFAITPGDASVINTSTGTVTGGSANSSYQIQYTTSGNCKDSVIQELVVNPTPSIPVVSEDATYCSGDEPDTLNAVSDTGSDYTWYNDAALSTIIATGNQLYPSTNGNGTTVYYVAAEMGDCKSDAALVTVTINPCDIVIPTAFTPGNNNINNFWEIVNLDTAYPDNTVYVYNRWGNLLYQSEKGKYNDNPWFGTFDGQDLPVGSYYFLIELNEEKSEKGTVTLIRN